MLPLRIDEILTTLKNALAAFAQNLGAGAQVSIARDPFNVFELLNAGTQNYVLALLWAGDENINDIPIIPLLRHNLELAFGYNLGLTARPDLALIQPVGNRPSLYQALDDIRTLLLSVQFGSNQTGMYLEYKGTEPVVTPDGIPLAAYRLSFGLRAIPAQSKIPTVI
jgi:hypothetical protein